MGRSHDIARGASTMYQTQAASDTRYANVSGDTFTGALTGTSAGFTGDVNIGNNDSSNPLSKLRLGGTQYGAADIRPTDEGGHKVGMAFYTDGTGDTTIDPVLRMTIDSLGRVTTPHQPAFRAWGATIYTTVGVMPFANVTQRGGTNYNTANGLFTAPIAGWYFFNFHFLTHSTGSRNDTYFEKNGGVFVEQRNYKSSGNHETHTLTAVDYLAANDTMGVRNVTGDVYAYQTWTSYYGFLLG